MKKALLAIALFASFLSCSIPAAAQYSLADRLGIAVSSGRVEEVRALLEKGADINARAYGRPPLMVATGSGNVEMVKLLLENGADTEGTDQFFNKTALIEAAELNGVAVARVLLEKGAKIEAKDSYGCTPLIAAIRDKKTEMVKFLLEKGADVEAKDNYGGTAMATANSQGPVELVDLLEIARRDKRRREQAQQQGQQLDQAEWKNPQERLAAHVKLLQQYPRDQAAREKVIALAVSLPEPQPVPEEARQLFTLAVSQIKQASTPQALGQPIALLRKAVDIAPWWANAYYNLSRALEMSGQYDEAIRELNYYLKLNPPETDAREARAHIVVIQTERDAANDKQR